MVARSLALLGILTLANACGSPVRPDAPGVIRSNDVVSGTGTMKFHTFEGGFWVVYGDDKVAYDPLNLPETFKREGLRVRFRGRVTDLAGTHMAGPIVELLEIAKL